MPAVPQRSSTTLVRRARRMHRVLAETYPEARCELDYRTPFELLVATILSAQTTDRRVNAVTPALFATWPDADALAGAARADVEAVIHPTGFFRAKAQSIQLMAADLAVRFGGEVPGTLDELVTLHGVGRKTANVVLGEAFGVPGITVDTHVARLSARMGWVDVATASNPVRAEHAIGALFEPRDWTMLNHRLIWHGRRRCHARKPACGACPVSRWCPSFGLGPTDPVLAERLVTTQGPA